MDSLKLYRAIVESVLDRYTRVPYAQSAVTCEAVFDRERDRYVLITVGWNERKRVYHPVIHIDIIGGKLWIQVDNTDRDVAMELVGEGIPKSDIVLAFRQPEIRKLTEFAVA